MNLARWGDGFHEAERGDFVIDGDGDVGPEAILFEEPVVEAGILRFEIGDDLTDGCAFDVEFGASVRQMPQEIWDEDFWHQIASMMAGGFMGSRVRRVPMA